MLFKIKVISVNYAYFYKSYKDVILPDIKFILLANNIISMNLC